MKKWIAAAALGSTAIIPWATAQMTNPDFDAVLQAAVSAGVTQFHSVELDDDGRYPVEIEGWMGSEFYVELEMAVDGEVGREQRRPSQAEPSGLTLDEVRSYLRMANQQGAMHIEEISVNRWGIIEVDGIDNTGRELELEFRRGETAPINTTNNQ